MMMDDNVEITRSPSSGASSPPRRARPIDDVRDRARARSRGCRANWNGASHVLAVRLDALGDVLMTTPALRAARPGHRVTLLTSPAGAEVAALVSDVDAVIVYDAPWVKATDARADSTPDHAMLAPCGVPASTAP
jgi:hypothetical protein